MPSLSGKSILVVDDEPLLREILVEFFHAQGATSHEAADGKAALELLIRNRIDIVLSDVRMPGGDGTTLMREINEKLEYKPIRFLFSGFSDLTEVTARELGAVALISKPFKIETLLELILTSLKSS